MNKIPDITKQLANDEQLAHELFTEQLRQLDTNEFDTNDTKDNDDTKDTSIDIELKLSGIIAHMQELIQMANLTASPYENPGTKDYTLQSKRLTAGELDIVDAVKKYKEVCGNEQTFKRYFISIPEKARLLWKLQIEYEEVFKCDTRLLEFDK